MYGEIKGGDLRTIATSVANFAKGRAIPDEGNSLYPGVSVGAGQKDGEKGEKQENGREKAFSASTRSK